MVELYDKIYIVKRIRNQQYCCSLSNLFSRIHSKGRHVRTHHTQENRYRMESKMAISEFRTKTMTA